VNFISDVTRMCSLLYLSNHPGVLIIRGILILFYSQCSYLYKESCFLLCMCSWNPLPYEIYPILDKFLYYCKWEHPEHKCSRFTPRTVLKFQLERLGFWLSLVKCFAKIPKEYPPPVFLEIIPYFFPTVDLQCHHLLTQIKTFQVWMCNSAILLPEGGTYFKQ